MATTPKKGLPQIWVTWATKILAGKDQCVWKAWFKAHFKYDKRQDNFDLEAWGADHDRMVQQRKGEFEVEGAKVRVENQNWLRLQGETAVLLGKPDLVAELGAQFTISDGKTGDPSKSDWFQMLLYLYMLPKVWQNPSLRLTGEVFYKSGSRIQVHPEEFTADRKKETFSLIRVLAESTPPKRTPSAIECRFCDIADCPERVAALPSDIFSEPQTDEF